MKRGIVQVVVVLGAMFPAVAQDVPGLMNYQGTLIEAGGQTAATGTYSLKFRIWDQAQGGTVVWGPQVFDGVAGTGHADQVQVVDGNFNVVLGPEDVSGQLLTDAFSGAERYLQIAVEGPVAKTYTWLTPFQQVLSTPFALKTGEADNADTLDGQHGWFYRNASSLNGGALSTDRFSAHGDLEAEGKIGTGATQVATGNHLHDSRYYTESEVNSALAGKADTTDLVFGITANMVSGGDGDDDFVFGSTQLDDTGDTTQDARVFFDKSKGAFRAGAATGTDWDAAKVGDYSFAAGRDNEASGLYATAGGGHWNDVTGEFATVAGGSENDATALGSTVAGGWRNVSSAQASFVGGGYSNTASGKEAMVGCGFENEATGDYSTIAGGYENEALAPFATIGGGGPRDGSGFLHGNIVYDEYGTVAGGGANKAGTYGTDTTDAMYATVGGGKNNTASGPESTVGGGDSSTASGDRATVGGGGSNTASGMFATVAGGYSNEASNARATVAGGYDNTASGLNSAVGGGFGNTASGTSATVAGGSDNEATGDNSYAAGNQAKALHNGSFVWADSTYADFSSDHADQFKVRATGGVSIHDNGGSSNLFPPALRVETTSSNGVAFYATQTSSDATLVVGNDGTGDLIKGFNNGDLRFAVSRNGHIYADGTLHSPAKDFAEYLPKRNATDVLEAGDVVGVHAHGVSRNTDGAERVLVITTKPLVLGNAPDNDDRSAYAPVAMLGQVPIKVRSAVRAGDYLVASGAHDGTATAFSPAQVTAEQFGQVVGCALESSEHEGVTPVLASVGFSRDRLWSRALQERDGRITALEHELDALKTAVAALAAK